MSLAKRAHVGNCKERYLGEAVQEAAGTAGVYSCPLTYVTKHKQKLEFSFTHMEKETRSKLAVNFSTMASTK